MNQELGFETIPFEIAPEFQSEEFEVESERGGRRPFGGGGSRSLQPRTQPGLQPRGTKRPPIPRPRPIPRGPRRPWEVIREPYGLLSAPYPGEPEPSSFGSEHVRWVQDCLNQTMKLQLPLTGVMGPETRSAVRSFQKQQGFRVSGIVSPKTEQALSSACEGGQASRGPSEELEDFLEVLTSNGEFEMAFEFDPEFEGAGEYMTVEADGEFEFDQEFESGTQARQPTDLGEIVICGGKPFAVLDNFSFNKSTLRKDSTRNHPAQVDAIAHEIMRRAARRKPVPSVCIVGHTDDAGSLDYNYGFGLQRAKTVKEALCKALGKYAGSMTFVVNSMGETDPVHSGKTPAARAGNRRVDVHLLSERVNGEKCSSSGGGGRKLPPDTAGCGIPKTSLQREFEISEELEEWEREAPRSGTGVQPKLCLYLEASDSSHRNHFQHQALGAARRIGAIGSPDAANCKRRVGATPFKTGADIIGAIRAAWQCAGKKPIQSVHIFGHSGSYGIFGNTGGTLGLYQNSYSLDVASRSSGGRTIADIPTDILSDNVIFVLHGCNQAYGCNEKGDDNNFAQSLLEHLSSTLKNPKVYGHYNSGCAGRDNSWCMYSKKLPKGKARSRPNYSDPGGCTPVSKEYEFEWQEERMYEDRPMAQTTYPRPRKVGQILVLPNDDSSPVYGEIPLFYSGNDTDVFLGKLVNTVSKSFEMPEMFEDWPVAQTGPLPRRVGQILILPNDDTSPMYGEIPIFYKGDAPDLFLGSVINSVRRFAKKAAGTVADLSSSVADTLGKVPLIGAGLKGLYGLTYGALIQTANNVVSGVRIDKAVSRHLESQVKNIREVAPYVQTIISLVPAVGPGISGAISAGLTLAQGKTLDEALVNAAIGALPGGALAKSVAKMAVAAASGKPLSDIAVSALPIPPGAKEAVKAGLRVASDVAQGKRVDKSFLAEANRQIDRLPPEYRKAAQIGVALGQGKKAQDIVKIYRKSRNTKRELNFEFMPGMQSEWGMAQINT